MRLAPSKRHTRHRTCKIGVRGAPHATGYEIGVRDKVRKSFNTSVSDVNTLTFGRFGAKDGCGDLFEGKTWLF